MCWLSERGLSNYDISVEHLCTENIQSTSQGINMWRSRRIHVHMYIYFASYLACWFPLSQELPYSNHLQVRNIGEGWRDDSCTLVYVTLLINCQPIYGKKQRYNAKEIGERKLWLSPLNWKENLQKMMPICVNGFVHGSLPSIWRYVLNSHIAMVSRLPLPEAQRWFVNETGIW